MRTRPAGGVHRGQKACKDLAKLRSRYTLPVKTFTYTWQVLAGPGAPRQQLKSPVRGLVRRIQGEDELVCF